MKKVIHCCWFGKGEKNELIKKCMNSWKVSCPEYEIKEWNEENFDIKNSNEYVREAYKMKKWAFVSDYVRLYALYEEGGVYLDTDVEVFDNFDVFFEDKFISGYHSNNAISTSTIISNKENNLVKELLEWYNDKNFIKKDGSCDETTNIDIITSVLVEKYSLSLDGKEIVNSDIHIYPKNIFTENILGMKNIAIHHFNASWISKEKAMEQVKAFKCNYNLTLKWLEWIINKKEMRTEELSSKKICIYGNGNLGTLLNIFLQDRGIKVKCIADSICNGKFNNKVRIVEKSKLVDEELDIVIVTPIYHFENIKAELSVLTKANIISLEELF